MENSNHFGKVYLIGAGPGDPGLLTVRGKSILEKAAGLKNLTLSSYILTSSLRQAQIDLAENDTLLLSDKSRNLVMAALENPPKPNAALKGLFR